MTEAIDTMTEEPPALVDQDDQNIEIITGALDSGDHDTIADILKHSAPVDTAALLAKMRDGQRTVLLTDFFEDIPPEAFADIDTTLLQQILPEIGAGRTAGIISALESDDALDLIIDQEPDFQQRIMHKLSARMRLTLEEGLNFPEDSAGRLMQREVVAVPHFLVRRQSPRLLAGGVKFW